MEFSERENEVFQLLGQKEQAGQDFSEREQEVYGLLKQKRGPEVAQDVPVEQPDVQQQGSVVTPTTEPDIPWKDVASGAYDNFGDSAKEYGSNLWQAIRHPIQTGEQFYGLLAGAIETAIPGGEDKHKEVFDETVDFFKDRYGGQSFGEVINSIKHTMAEDPVGFLSDISLVISGGSAGALKVVQGAGKVASFAGKGARASGAVSTANKVNAILQKTQMLDPANIATKVGLKGASKAVKGFVTKEKAHRGLSDTVQQTLKMKNTLERNDFLSTAFTERGYNITEADMKAMGKNRMKLGKELENATIKATQENAPMYHRDEFVQIYDDMLNNMSKNKLEGTRRGAYRAEIEGLRDSFIKEYPEQMTLNDLHNMRSGIEFIKGADQEFGKVANKLNAKKRAMISTIMEDVFPEIGGEAKKYKKKFTKKGKKDKAPTPDVEGDISTAGYNSIADELGIQKELQTLLEDALNKERSVGLTGSKGLIVGGAANVFAGVVTGHPGAGMVGAVGYVTAAYMISKAWSDPRVRVAMAKKVAKSRNIRLSVAKKLVDERVTAYMEKLATGAQQAGRVGKIAEGEQQ